MRPQGINGIVWKVSCVQKVYKAKHVTNVIRNIQRNEKQGVALEKLKTWKIHTEPRGGGF